MSLKDIWKDKVDGVDDVLAEDINSIAQEVIKLENEFEDVPDINQIPTKVSQLENDTGYLTEHQDISGKADTSYVDDRIGILTTDVDALENNKADKGTTLADYGITNACQKPVVIDVDTEFSMNVRDANNYIYRCSSDMTSISFMFYDGEYPEVYYTELSFNSGEIPTSINYPNGDIIYWTGTDCAISQEGIPLFIPSANKHYDIMISFNGNQFVGYVYGFEVVSA